MIGAISLHYYTLQSGERPMRNESKAVGFPESEPSAILYQAARMDDVMKAQEAVLDKNDPAKRIGLLVDEWGSWYAPTPVTNGAMMAKTLSYYVFKMYLPFQDATLLRVEVSAPKITSGKYTFLAISVSAARGKDGKVHIAVANFDTQNSQSIRIALDSIKSVVGILVVKKVDFGLNYPVMRVY
jgi:alpha-L-arabinofuranosidase